MGRITTGVGLISGINTGSIIDQLISLDSAPVTALQKQITTGTSQKSAFSDLQTQLDGLKTIGTTLTNANTFQAATTSSSDEHVLTATAANNAAIGTFQLQVAQLVSAQQAVTAGFADPNQTKIGTGTITISQGGGELSTQTSLASLNGGTGVNRGLFKITDRSGKTAAIDISSALTLDDVARKINTSLDISVKATLGKNGLVLTDETGQTTGQTTSKLIVRDLGNGTAAKDLGILGSVAADTITGSSVNTIGRATALAQINDGRGIGTAASGGDVQITAGDGSTFSVSLGASKTIGNVLDAINADSGGKILADIAPGGNGIRLNDTSGGGGAITVAALNASTAAADLGIAGSSAGTLNGRGLTAALDSTLISSLNGGKGLPLGTIGIADRTGHGAAVDLSGATSVQDILDGINNSGAQLKASLNGSGNGIQVIDTSGGTGQLKIWDVNSTTADALGIHANADPSVPVVNGANLHRQYVTSNTLLTDYNGGKGVALGKFRVTASDGTQSTVDLSGGNFVTVGDILKTINARGIGVTASINANGNGILLTDTAAGPGQLKVEDTSGTAAADLNLAGTATGATLDGSFEKTIAVDLNDTLTTVQTKINALGFGATASIINDGSGATPYRLSLTARNTGRAGRFVFDAGTTGLATSNLVAAQDAAVFIGGQNSAAPLLVTSSTNQLTNVIKGVTIDLHNASANPVTLSITRDPTAVSTQLKQFTDGFNGVVTKLTSLTSFDTKTQKAGLLLGDSTAQSIQTDLYAILNGVVKNAGRFKIFADLGVTVGDGGQLSFNADKFNSAFATDPGAVSKLFTQATTGLGTVITKQINKLTDPVNGAIPITTKTIDTRNQDFQTRITDLNALLQSKRDRLTKQFANMETVLAGLQSQQQALGSLNGLLTSNNTTSKSSSNSTSGA